MKNTTHTVSRRAVIRFGITNAGVIFASHLVKTPAFAGGPTSLPLHGGNDLAIWFGTNGPNDGITGGPSLRVADTRYFNGSWEVDPYGTTNSSGRSIIDLDPTFLNPGAWGNIYLGGNRPEPQYTKPWRGEIYHFDGQHIRLRQYPNPGAFSVHPDQNIFVTETKNKNTRLPGAIVAPRFATNWQECGGGLRCGPVVWQIYSASHGWYYNNQVQQQFVIDESPSGPYANTHYIGFYQNVNLWQEFGGNPPVNVKYPFNNMNEVLISFWGLERHWFGWHNGVYYGQVRFDNGNISNLPMNISAAYDLAPPTDLSQIRCKAWHDATGRPMLESGHPNAGKGPGCPF